MRRTAPILVAALVVVGTLAAVPTAGLAQTATATATATATPTPDSEGTDANETDENATAPGDLLEGVLGVQEAEVEGELENRTFGIRVAQAATAEAKADVVAERLQRNRERIAELEERKQELNESLASGNMSRSEHRAEIAQLAVQSHNVQRLTNRTANVSEGLPADVLREKGINVTAIRTLAERADKLTGPEIAEIARSIAGPSVADGAREGPSGQGARDGSAADDRGTAGDRDGNRTAGGTDRGTERPADGGSDSGSDDSGGSGGTADGSDGGSGTDSPDSGSGDGGNADGSR